MRPHVLFSMLGAVGALQQHWWDELLATLRVPPSFAVSVYADSIPEARTLAIAPDGMVFSSTGFPSTGTDQGRVYACRDANRDRDALDAGECFPVTELMTMPNGLTFMNGDLYIAEIERVVVIRDVQVDPTTIKVPVEVLGPESSPGAADGLPSYLHHGWRYLTSNPETGQLAIAIGAPCNVPWTGNPDPGIDDCGNQLGGHPLLATIATFNADGTNLAVVARGVRNAVGITYHPITQEIWFTENGRDQWGSSGSSSTPDTSAEPPDELNRLGASMATNLSRRPNVVPDFGFPACYGRDLPDVALDTRGQPFNPTGECDPEQYVGAVAELPSHAAALGLRFYDGSLFPPRWQNRAFIAERGSWNRWPPSGFALSTIDIGSDPAVATAATGAAAKADDSYEEFLTGFRAPPGLERRCTSNADCPGNSTCQSGAPPDGSTLLCGGRGQPVDVEVMQDGSILVTDEMNSLIYRITYVGSELKVRETSSEGDTIPKGNAGEKDMIALLSFMGVAILFLGMAVACLAVRLCCTRRTTIGVDGKLYDQLNRGA